MIKSVAICAGSGNTLLRECNADLYITGELSHHDVLYFSSYKKSACIMLEHFTSEKGYLKILIESLTKEMNELTGILIIKYYF